MVFKWQVRKAGRVVGGVGYGLPGGHVLMRFPLQQEPCCSFQSVQPTVMSLQGQNNTGTITLTVLVFCMSRTLSGGCCIELTARTAGPQAYPSLTSLAHHCLMSLFSFYKEKFYKTWWNLFVRHLRSICKDPSQGWGFCCSKPQRYCAGCFFFPVVPTKL